MTWYWTIHGSHTHVKVFMNRALCGKLVFTNDEFQTILNNASLARFIKFVEA